jgi:hypothetical protein
MPDKVTIEFEVSKPTLTTYPPEQSDTNTQSDKTDKE